MANAMEVILLQRVDSLGNMGEKVRVKPGYARNYLLPQGKALRATEKNVAYFESQKAGLEKLNAERRAEAEKEAKKLEGMKVTIIRHASEAGQLYGSVSTRDIAEGINAQGKAEVARTMVTLSTTIKSVGLFPATVALHPEVKTEITVNVARSEEEAKVQLETGRALVADNSRGRREPEPEAQDAEPETAQSEEGEAA